MDRAWRNVITDRKHFITSWPAEDRSPMSGYSGTADAVFRNLEIIEALGSRLVLVLAGDHIYKMDYRPLLEYHCERNADVTIGCVAVPIEDAHHFGVMSVDELGRISHFVEKPKALHRLPRSGDNALASMGIYVFDAELLARVLKLDAISNDSRHDFGRDILPSLVSQAKLFAYPFRGSDGAPGYWRDIGTPSAYWRAHLDLLGPSPRLHLDDPSWPLRNRDLVESAPHYIERNAAGTIESSLVAAGCAVRRARVRRSVLFSGASVAAGSEIAESIVLPNAVIGRRCRLRGAIVDSGCHIPDDTVIGEWISGHTGAHTAEPTIVTADNIRTNLVRPTDEIVREGAVA
jgi:glucose-1-phosphate adenylyltransferase